MRGERANRGRRSKSKDERCTGRRQGGNVVCNELRVTQLTSMLLSLSHSTTSSLAVLAKRKIFVKSQQNRSKSGSNLGFIQHHWCPEVHLQNWDYSFTNVYVQLLYITNKPNDNKPNVPAKPAGNVCLYQCIYKIVNNCQITLKKEINLEKHMKLLL